MPESIEPGGVGEVAVSLKVGRSTGRRTVAFTVETDSPERPQIHLELSADLYADWEVTPLTATPLKLPPGRSGEIEMKLVCRKDGKYGRALPRSIEAPGTLHTVLESEAEVPGSSGRIRECSRVFRLGVGPRSEIGLHRGALRFLSQDGGEDVWEFAYEVTPAVLTYPSSVFLRADGGRAVQRIRVQSDDGPRRILEVTSRLLAAPYIPSGEASRTHDIQVELQVPPMPLPDGESLRIRTDSADQPVATVPVFILPTSSSGG